MSLKQQDYSKFLQSVVKKQNFTSNISKDYSSIQILDEKGEKQYIDGQDKLEVTINEITLAAKIPRSEQKNKGMVIQIKFRDDYQRRRKLRQERLQKEYLELSQFWEKRTREIKYLRKQQVQKKEKKNQLQVRNYFAKKKENKQKRDQNLSSEFTLSDTEQLILALAAYLGGIIQTSIIQTYLPITQKQAVNHLLGDKYNFFLLTKDLLLNYKTKIFFIYSQPNIYLIDLFERFMEVNGFIIEQILELCDETPSFPAIKHPIPFASLFGQNQNKFIGQN